MTLLTRSGLTIGEAIQQILSQCSVPQATAKAVVQDSLYTTTVNHIHMRYPGSTHWDTSKVKKTPDGGVGIDIAGASRAYHDIDIRPIRAKFLAIPIHAAAYGKSPKDFGKQLFTIKGKRALFIKKGSGIVAMFALAKKAHQPQDKTLLPSDATYSKNISTRVAKLMHDQQAKGTDGSQWTP